jgi:hypothetical protein
MPDVPEGKHLRKPCRSWLLAPWRWLWQLLLLLLLLLQQQQLLLRRTRAACSTPLQTCGAAHVLPALPHSRPVAPHTCCLLYPTPDL